MNYHFGNVGDEHARAKHRYMAGRTHVPATEPTAEQLLEQALAALDDL